MPWAASAGWGEPPQQAGRQQGPVAGPAAPRQARVLSGRRERKVEGHRPSRGRERGRESGTGRSNSEHRLLSFSPPPSPHLKGISGVGAACPPTGLRSPAQPGCSEGRPGQSIPPWARAPPCRRARRGCSRQGPPGKQAISISRQAHGPETCSADACAHKRYTHAARQAAAAEERSRRWRRRRLTRGRRGRRPRRRPCPCPSPHPSAESWGPCRLRYRTAQYRQYSGREAAIHLLFFKPGAAPGRRDVPAAGWQPREPTCRSVAGAGQPARQPRRPGERGSAVAAEQLLGRIRSGGPTCCGHNDGSHHHPWVEGQRRRFQRPNAAPAAPARAGCRRGGYEHARGQQAGQETAGATREAGAGRRGRQPWHAASGRGTAGGGAHLPRPPPPPPPMLAITRSCSSSCRRCSSCL